MMIDVDRRNILIFPLIMLSLDGLANLALLMYDMWEPDKICGTKTRHACLSVPNTYKHTYYHIPYKYTIGSKLYALLTKYFVVYTHTQTHTPVGFQEQEMEIQLHRAIPTRKQLVQ